MPRNTPSEQETRHIIDYFWERLTETPEAAHGGDPVVDLAKKSRYYARRELHLVKNADHLLEWSYKWVDNESWKRARDNVRSRRYKSKHSLSRINVTQSVKETFEKRASHHGLPTWQYLACLNLDADKLVALEKQEGFTASPNAR